MLWVSILVGLVVGIGFILLIIPGIIFLTMLSVTIPALIVEDHGGTAAMGRSWNLVKGHFWHVLGMIVVAGSSPGVVGAIISVARRQQLVPPDVDLRRSGRSSPRRSSRSSGRAVRRPPLRATKRLTGEQLRTELEPHTA